MLRHIVMWKFKEGVSESENKKNAQEVKAKLEALKDSISEIIEIKVHINALPTCSMDVMLDSLFENEDTMNAYKVHPDHVRVAAFVSSVLQDRADMDYYE